MDDTARTDADDPPVRLEPGADTIAVTAAAHWSPDLPVPPWVDVSDESGAPRFVPLSPRVVVLAVGLLALLTVLWLARDAVRPFIVGLLIVYLLDPPVRWLVRLRVPRPLGILAVYALVVVAFVEFLNLTLSPLVTEISRFVDDLPGLLDQLDAQLQRLAEIYAGLALPEAVREWIDHAVAQIVNGGEGFDPGIIIPVLTGAGSLIGVAFGYIILPVWAFFLLKDRVRLTVAFDRALPSTWRPDMWAVIRIVDRVFGQWIRAQVILGVTVGVFTFIGLTALSEFVDPIFGRYALLLSIIAGVLELLPIIGPIIAAVPAVILAATVGLEATIAALVLYTVVQQLENNLLVPKIQGDAVQLHPSAVIFALIIGGALGGLLGAILALPVAAASRDIVRYLFRRHGTPDPDTMRALAIDLGIKPPPIAPESSGG
jgi:predicted PurR-regulated permease PerM